MSDDTTPKDTQHSLHALKKIEIIVRGEKEPFVKDLLDDSTVSGYTIHHNVTGRGEHGFHEGRLLFNDRDGLVMFFAVGQQEAIQTIVDGLTPLFEKSSGVMFVSDTQVVRLDKFLQED
ncbi:P-II family nitrogen regulator [Salinibacter altiplanensis]|uniref:P-II family nitrogen regulator n=1 Tax=Salinibacter altiplanensis TaxID=1803181 RepID=UPI000C9F689D|nr:P-II family nitrogen regulator [Salinibacter altiplanensis]